MSDPAGTYYDGNFVTPAQVGPVIPWQDEETGALMAEATFWVRAPFFDPGTIDSSAGSILASGYLVSESKPTLIDGDVLEYTRTYATVPPDRSEPLPYVYPFQIVYTGGTEAPQIVEIPIPVTAKVTFSYERSDNPTSIDLSKAFKAAQVQESIVFFGIEPNPGDEILAEDEGLSKWKGKIWEKKTVTITARDITEA